jgi:7,8-dihydro-6-hydroxymethylpterin dimethyltransferase
LTVPVAKAVMETESLCPACLERVAASVVAVADEIFLEKTCEQHGFWRIPLWRGAPAYEEWRRPKAPGRPEICYTGKNSGCPFDCGLCEEHRQSPCSVLLEVTQRCTLGCPVCFASIGDAPGRHQDPDVETISWLFDRVTAAAGPCNIQLSGGEPTERDDLPEIIALGRRKGFSFIQLNTNGLRLATEPGYAKVLAEAGLTTVFLQFDGTDDLIYTTLRGRPLAREKTAAVDRCGEAGLGVVLVPTLVPGVNTGAIGSILRFALERLPLVRGVHFQPISHFGRYASVSPSLERFTLPEVMRAIEEQTDGLMKASDFVPPGTENARCSFHSSFFALPDGRLRRLSSSPANCCVPPDGREGLRRTIGTVARQWSAAPAGNIAGKPVLGDDPVMGLDAFLERATNHSLSVSCMAFQDAWNLDMERLRECCIAVMSPAGKMIPFCAYNLTSTTGQTLYRNRQEAPR